MSAARCMFRYSFWKRTIDFSAAFLLLLFFAPVILVVAVLIRWRMGQPVLFLQERGGLHNSVFTVVKFRTMQVGESQGTADAEQDESRLTGLGRVLRRYSLDELPQLWNVLRGEMSLVGPRPLLAEYLPLYSETQAKRHRVRPGITGLAQVRGRNGLSWPERFALDLEYVERLSWWLDMYIVLKTALQMIGVSRDDAEHFQIPEKFRG